MTIIDKILEFDLKKYPNLIELSKLKTAIKKFKDTYSASSFEEIDNCPMSVLEHMYPETDTKTQRLWETLSFCHDDDMSVPRRVCNGCWVNFVTYDIDKQNGLIYISKDNDSHKCESNKIDITPVIDRMKELSFKERKTMVERALKLGEEFGEVSEAVLSYKDVAGCGYKKKTIDDVREEAIDVIIMGFSLLFHPDESMNEKDMVKEFNRKLNKWESKMERDEIDNEVDK